MEDCNFEAKKLSTVSSVVFHIDGNHTWRDGLDKEHLKGTKDKVKGSVKDTVGSMTGNKRMQAEGKIDKAKGAVRQTVGDVKDKVGEHTD
jgi:uncharacterized protein YjbJ (UPF0337 family)